MSERAVPTKPGFWWCSFCGNKAVREVYVEESESPDDTFLAVLDDAGEPWGVFSKEIQWIAPVPSSESVQAAIANAQFILDGDGVLPAYRQLLVDAIAGLTGVEG